VWGLVITYPEQEHRVITNLVMCVAVGISHITVYSRQSVFRRNNSRVMGEILKEQQELLGLGCSKCSAKLEKRGDRDDHEF
jgi:dehydrodolichyl diphosphate syntase complex subunit NUS1